MTHPSSPAPVLPSTQASLHILVTGGAGFLSSFVVEKLRERGATDIVVPRSKDYNLRDINTIRRLFRDVGAKSEIRNPKSEIAFRNPNSEIRNSKFCSEIPNPKSESG